MSLSLLLLYVIEVQEEPGLMPRFLIWLLRQIMVDFFCKGGRMMTSHLGLLFLRNFGNTLVKTFSRQKSMDVGRKV